jgi:drug/metabolite transporter (DMT)-like permease
VSRLKADALLMLAAFIWGTAFVAQKDAFAHVGAFTFVAARFALSAFILIAPAVAEARRITLAATSRRDIALLCVVFCAGILLQQFGIGGTSVASAGFLTSLYVLFVPVICRLAYGQRLPAAIFPAAAACAAGVWLLSGGGLRTFAHFGRGDLLCLLTGVAFAAHIVLVGRVMQAAAAPFQASLLQYTVAALVAAAGAFIWEHPQWNAIAAAIVPVFYAGAISGGIAYTIQLVSQRHTPPSDGAIIMSAEAVFAALAGAVLRKEILTPSAMAGCALILAAIVLVELKAVPRKG